MTFSDQSLTAAPNNYQEIKNRLTSLTEEQVTLLRNCYRYTMLQASVRFLGQLNLFLGAATLFLGLNFTGNPFVKITLTLLGLVFVLVSLWSVMSPQPALVRVWSVLFAISGLWNLFTFTNNHRTSIVVFVLGLLQLWWCYTSYRAYRKNAQITLPDSEIVGLYNDLRQALQNISPKDDSDPDLIRLTYQRFGWQGFLVQNCVALVTKTPRRTAVLLIADKDKTTLTFADGKGFWKPRINGTFNLDGLIGIKVTFPALTLERYNRWKGLPDSESIQWLNNQAITHRKWLPLRILIGLILAAPIVVMLGFAILGIIMVATYGH